MKKSKVLLLEGHDVLRGVTSRLLQKYEIVAVPTLAEANMHMRSAHFDLALIDIGLGPRKTEALHQISEWRTSGERLPIISTSANSDPQLAVLAFRAGSDDYLRKPLRPDETIARIDRQIERYHERALAPAPKANGAYLAEDFDFGQIHVGKDLVISVGKRKGRIMAKQYDILRYFREHSGKLVLRENVRSCVWGQETNAGSNSLNTLISGLRKAFGQLKVNFDNLVKMEKGLGFRISDQVRSSSL